MSMIRRAIPELRSLLPRNATGRPSSLFPASVFEMDPFFRDFMAVDQRLRPAVNLSETDKEFIVEAEVPGMSKEKLDLQVQEDTLTISGHFEESKTEGNKWAEERLAGSFSRSMTFPGHHIEPKDISAQLRDGILKVTIPKKPVEGTKIEIAE